MQKEQPWAATIVKKMSHFLSARDENLGVFVEQNLIYLNEIYEYENESPKRKETMRYKTDILVYEWTSTDTWKPRVVIELKLSSVSTHDVITYSQKSLDHKTVHPCLRYGILIGNFGDTGIPGRVIRHGEYFDFMITWKSLNSSKIEWDNFIGIIFSEIQASRDLEKILSNTKSKFRQKISILHRKLITKFE